MTGIPLHNGGSRGEYHFDPVPRKKESITGGEDGNVLIISLILLVLLTLIGISATSTSMIEMQIAGNNMIYKRNLYLAEGAAYDAIQRMEETDLETSPPTWLAPETVTEDDILVTANWDGSFTGGKVASTSQIDPNGAARYVAVMGGIVATGESLDMTRVKIHEYEVYGRADRNNGISIVKMGYRKAF